MRVSLAVFLLIILFFTACRNSKRDQKWSDLPEVKNIGLFPRTEFVPTLENPIDGRKNVVYASAFLYAWDKAREELKEKISLTGNNSNDFKLLNESTSFRNSLEKNEYDCEVLQEGEEIMVKAFFNKTLPFPLKLQKSDKPIIFDKTKVSAFGIQSYDRDLVGFTEILYYKNDENFIIKFMPRDNEHQIILAKGISNVNSLAGAVQQTKKFVSMGNKERTDPNLSWKYDINEEDILSIPAIKFNIETTYDNIRDQQFTTKGKPHHVEMASQRTGFILDENGAVVESEAFVVLDSIDASPIRIIPKKMVFDKPFFVILQRTKTENPYFVLYVQNAELLIKE